MDLVGVIFSNIYDNTLGTLTKVRTVASVPFGARYRQIDFILSNMVNSDITSVGVITKYHYKSLMDHLDSRSEWELNHKNGGLFFLPPFADDHSGIYKGKIEALYRTVSFLERTGADYVLLADSNVICNIDFKKVLKAHIESGADITAVANREKEHMGEEKRLLFTMDGDSVSEVLLSSGADESKLCGMGMFIMERKRLTEMVENYVALGKFHFEKDFLQKEFNDGTLHINVYEFENTVLRNESIIDYYNNSFKLMDEKVRTDIFSQQNPIYTKVRDEVPTYYGEDSFVDDCLIADGCTIKGRVENCVLFRNVTVEEGCYIKNSIIFQGSVIEKNCQLDCVILDKDVRVTAGRMLIGSKSAPYMAEKAAKV